MIFDGLGTMLEKYSSEMRARAWRMLAEARPEHVNQMAAIRQVRACWVDQRDVAWLAAAVRGRWWTRATTR